MLTRHKYIWFVSTIFYRPYVQTRYTEQNPDNNPAALKYPCIPFHYKMLVNTTNISSKSLVSVTQIQCSSKSVQRSCA